MRVKLDENIPLRLVAALTPAGHDVDTVANEGLKGRSDTDVWTATQAERRLLITQDMDFSDARRYAPGTHCGILLVRMRDPGREAVLRRVADLFSAEPVAAWSGCIVVVTERKLRVRRRAPTGPSGAATE